MFLIKGSPSHGSENQFDGSDIIDIDVECADGVAVVTMAGELDVSNSEWLYECLHDAVDEGNSEVVVDVERLTFMDSTGLSVIVGAHKRLRATGGTLTVVAPTPIVVRLFQVCDDVPHLMIKDAPGASSGVKSFRPAPKGAA
jgi:anti-sigma B factor antagonist